MLLVIERNQNHVDDSIIVPELRYVWILYFTIYCTMQFKFKALVKVGSVVDKNSAMGASLSEPDTKLTTASCGNSYLKVGSSSMQGWRIQMEDAHTHLLSLPEDEKVSFFGVYDGHGGACASRYASCHLHKAIAQTKAFAEGDLVEAIKQGFLDVDKDMLENHGNLVGVAGTTAVIVMLKEDTLFCLSAYCLLACNSAMLKNISSSQFAFDGNVGDSRAVISAGGVAEPLSFDHKPVNEGEIKRIFSAGGWVEFNRVNGNLAMSRALGDFIYKACHEKSPKEQIVTAYPDVVSRSLTDADEFIVLACDGVWDVMTNQEVVDFCRERIAAGLAPEKICEELLLQCLAPDCQMGGLGCDNMTVILVCLLRDKPYEELMKKCIRDRPPTPVRRADELSQQFVTPPLSPADSQPVLPSGSFPEAIGSPVAIENENEQEKVEKKNEIVDCAVGDVKQLEELKPKVVDYNANESEEAGEKENTDEDDLVALFNNVKFVLCGDSAGRMLKLATFLCKQLKNSNGDEPTNLTRTDRYVLYKVSNCICIKQDRMDGTFCAFSLQQRRQFLQRAKELDVCNIDMEASCFTAFCQRAKLTVSLILQLFITNYKRAIVNVVLMDRLAASDQPADRNQRDLLISWEERPFAVFDEYVKQFSN
ncbi:putative protein phosphatase 2C T23F11.1 [Trichinella spiralis]|uniref:protein-serine/threonine phosphatase n=1 Tax=Trichinella spiralis TaxID=6334 RepID=A0A0V1BSK8_TRISP|nr:putative protein phosphatase 2C T23F11.1 [Trichinella spiralis]